MAHMADLAGQHHGARLLQRRDVAVGEVHHGDEAGGLGRPGHLVRLGVIFRQRLLAHDMLARRKQRQRRRMVRPVGRHVGRRVETVPGDRVIQRGEDVGNAVLLGEGPGARGVDVDGADQLDTLDRGEVLGMAVGHATRSKNKKTHRFPQR